MSNQVPEGWSIKKISDISKVIGGGTPERAKSEYWGGDIPWVSPSEITKLEGRYLGRTKEHITTQGLSNSSAKLHPIGTVLMTSRASIGYAAITTVPLTTNQGFQSFQCNEKVFNEYLYQQISWLKPKLENLAAGSTFLEISATTIKGLQVLVPPVPEQQKIAKILTSVDEVIEKTQAQIDKLKDLKTGMMQELLTQGVGVDGKPHTEFKDSPVGRIPKAWAVCTFNEIFKDYKYGPRFSAKDYDINGNVNTIRGTDLSSNGVIKYSQVPTAKLDEKLVSQNALEDGDLVMITTADCGATAVFEAQSIPYIASAYAIKLTPRKGVNSKYVNYFMQTDDAMSQVASFVRKGTVANLPGSDVMSIVMATPSLDEQNKIVNILAQLDKLIHLKSDFLSSRTALKKALMQDLLTGKVRVTID